MTGRGFHGLWGFAGGTDAACVCDRRWLPTREFEAHLVAERVAAILHDDATVEAVAEALWDEHAWNGLGWEKVDEGHREQWLRDGRAAIAVLAERLGVPHE
jgi:hypothetical protein